MEAKLETRIVNVWLEDGGLKTLKEYFSSELVKNDDIGKIATLILYQLTNALTTGPPNIKTKSRIYKNSFMYFGITANTIMVRNCKLKRFQDRCLVISGWRPLRVTDTLQSADRLDDRLEAIKNGRYDVYLAPEINLLTNGENSDIFSTTEGLFGLKDYFTVYSIAVSIIDALEHRGIGNQFWDSNKKLRNILESMVYPAPLNTIITAVKRADGSLSNDNMIAILPNFQKSTIKLIQFYNKYRNYVFSFNTQLFDKCNIAVNVKNLNIYHILSEIARLTICIRENNPTLYESSYKKI